MVLIQTTLQKIKLSELIAKQYLKEIKPLSFAKTLCALCVKMTHKKTKQCDKPLHTLRLKKTSRHLHFRKNLEWQKYLRVFKVQEHRI
jgi:hypothetical protein